MERESFKEFVELALEEVIQLAEQKSHKKLSRRFCFQWLGSGKPRICENVAEYIVERVYVDAEHIWPCIDIGVGDLLDDETLLIVGNVAGYPPTTFGRNWTGREGPFVYIVGSPFLARINGKAHTWSPELGSFGYTTPKVNGPVSAETTHPRNQKMFAFWKAFLKRVR